MRTGVDNVVAPPLRTRRKGSIDAEMAHKTAIEFVATYRSMGGQVCFDQQLVRAAS